MTPAPPFAGGGGGGGGELPPPAGGVSPWRIMHWQLESGDTWVMSLVWSSQPSCWVSSKPLQAGWAEHRLTQLPKSVTELWWMYNSFVRIPLWVRQQPTPKSAWYVYSPVPPPPPPCWLFGGLAPVTGTELGSGVGSVPVPPTGLTVVSKMLSPSAQPRLKMWIRSIENALERPLIRMVWTPTVARSHNAHVAVE